MPLLRAQVPSRVANLNVARSGVSMSWGSNEFPLQTAFNEFFTTPGVASIEHTNALINYTMPLSIQTGMAPRDLYTALASRHPVAYAAYLDLGDRHILSLSPELFL